MFHCSFLWFSANEPMSYWLLSFSKDLFGQQTCWLFTRPVHSPSCVWLQNVQTLENVGVPSGYGGLLKMWGTFEDVDVAMWCSRVAYTIIPEGSWHSTNLGEKQFKMTIVVLQMGMPEITSFHSEFLGTKNRHLYLELSWNWSSLKMQKIMFGE